MSLFAWSLYFWLLLLFYLDSNHSFLYNNVKGPLFASFCRNRSLKVWNLLSFFTQVDQSPPPPPPRPYYTNSFNFPKILLERIYETWNNIMHMKNDVSVGCKLMPSQFLESLIYPVFLIFGSASLCFLGTFCCNLCRNPANVKWLLSGIEKSEVQIGKKKLILDPKMTYLSHFT